MRLRAAWAGFWDRMSSSDPGLLRLQNAVTVAGAVLLALGVLGLLQAPVAQLVVGGLIAMVASFAISDVQPRAQAVTLACGLPVTCVAMILGTTLYPHRVAADAVFVALVFTAVYIRRFGPRGTGLGLMSFQSYFVSQFAHAPVAEIPRLLGIVAIGFAASAVMRFGAVRNSPERTLARLERAFAVRWAAVVEAAAVLADHGADGRDPADAVQALRRRTTRLHQCALMLQSRLEAAVPDPQHAALLEIRFAETEVAAERLGKLMIRACSEPGRAPASSSRLAAALRGSVAPVLAAAARESRRSDEQAEAALDELLAFREPRPAAGAAVEPVERAAADLAHAALGLITALRGDAPFRGDAALRADGGSRHEEIATEGELRARAQADRPTPEKTAGLRRRTTRLAFQVAAGSALAIVGGELLSEQRWYWAVLTCWVVFINTSSTGEILVKGYRRVVGTIAGVLAGGLLAAQLAPHPWAAFALAIACVFGMFFTAAVSYSLMSFFVTTMIGLLYTLLGTFSPDVLVLRIEETALGAACGFIAATLVLPVRLDRHTDEQLLTVIDRLGTSVEVSATRIADPQATARPLHTARELDTALDALHSAMEPVIHPANPLRPRRQRALYLTRLLDGCTYHARALAALAQTSRARPAIDADTAELVRATASRVEHNAAVLASRLNGHRLADADEWSAETQESVPDGAAPTSAASAVAAATANRALTHLQRIDEGLGALARVVGVATESD